jgi:very-short-patch-repair endonuclease/DNA modification methylase
MARKKKTGTKRPIESYEHRDKERINNPPVGLVTPDTDPDAGQKKKRYAYDPHLDPQLQWAGKAEHTSFEVPTVSLHVHERIDPRTIIEAVRKRNGNGQPVLPGLFEDERKEPLRQAVEFYQHKHGWSNRLIAGDSLLVMNSLLEKEGMAGKVQMIYIDPPYGIKYGSNFQPFVNKRDVKDGKDEDLTAEPEQIRAFRDTWELGIHSYLTYLRNRLLLARELLHESGSIFVQISDENVHHVRELMDEVFGVGNFCSVIAFVKTTSQTAELLASISDYLLWYAKDRPKVKYRQLFVERDRREAIQKTYQKLEMADGTIRNLRAEELENPELIPSDTRVLSFGDLVSQSGSESTRQPFDFGGKRFVPRAGGWKTNRDGLARLAAAGRLGYSGTTLLYKRYIDDFPFGELNALWQDTKISGFFKGEEKVFVVQTPVKVIARCLLMTTDPGDLVFDPTCVRKGTRVWVCSPTPTLPARGAVLAPTPTLPARGEGVFVPPPSTGEVRRGAALSVSTGEARRGEPLSVSTGEVRREEPTSTHLTPIEQLQPGDLVLGHDGQPHRVLRVIHKRRRGLMVGIRHAHSAETLWCTADHRILCKPRPRTLGGNRDWSASPPEHLDRRRALRREMTPPEKQLWYALRNGQLGVKFRRQHPIGAYIADFYSRDAHLVVEIDGATHSEPGAVEYDQQRDAYMRSLGLDILRFTAQEVQQNLEGVCLAIQNQCRLRVERVEGAVWLQAGSLQPGDIVFFGANRVAVPVEAVDYAYTDEEVYDLEVEGTHSFITEVCVVHNCGSGTTAYVAEQWGRRWITCDTSRVALTLARQRLMTAVFDYYELAHPEEGVGSGFKYKTVPHVTLKSIANNPEIDGIHARWQARLEPVRDQLNRVVSEQWIVDSKKARSNRWRNGRFQEKRLMIGRRRQSSCSLSGGRCAASARRRSTPPSPATRRRRHSTTSPS